MKPYSTKELEALLVNIESDIVERKESWKGDAPTKSRQAVCAFANDFADYRNPDIAEAMKVLGFVQRFGVGIQMAQAELAENGNPPAEFKIDLTTIICTLREGEKTRNIKTTADVPRQQESGVESGVESELAIQILSILANNLLGKAEIARQLGKSKPSRHLNELMTHLLQKGFVEYTIPGKPNSRLQKYRLTDKGRKKLAIALSCR